MGYSGSPDWRAKRAQKAKAAHGYQLRDKYGLTPQDYTDLFTKQEGRCALCKRHQVDMSRRLCVDHDHITGEVRGLLCISCNTKIGPFERYTIRELDDIVRYLRGE